MPVSLVELRPLDAINLRGRVEDKLRGAILGGAFGLGERLVESTIAAQLGVSRAPVREALSALEREGLVTKVPNRGHFVLDLAEKDVEEIYSLRLLLEAEALRRAIRGFTAADVATMQRIVDDLGEAVLVQRDSEVAETLDFSFHDLICRAADHGRLYSAWNSMRLQTRLLIRLSSRTSFDYPDQPKDFHQSVLDAIAAGDVARAEARLRRHILDAERRARKALGWMRAQGSTGTRA